MKAKIYNYPCEIEWITKERTETLVITIDNFPKVKGKTTDRDYIKKILNIKE